MSDTEPFEVDFVETRYRVEGHDGIAWYAVRYRTYKDEDWEWSGYEAVDYDRVVCVMVGDDREFEFELTDLTPLKEDEYCPECGQIGCKAYNLVDMQPGYDA